MSGIEFTKEEKEVLVKRIQMYFTEELDQEIARFDAEFLLDFFGEEIGPYFYNRALYDAQVILEKKIENITEAFVEIEKVTEFRK